MSAAPTFAVYLTNAIPLTSPRLEPAGMPRVAAAYPDWSGWGDGAHSARLVVFEDSARVGHLDYVPCAKARWPNSAAI
jgi:hypothetical protein